MVTGIEAAGVALAIISLIVNQADNYVRGLETLGKLRTRRYRREMQSYYNSLSTQRVILENILEQCLQGVVEYEEDIFELINDPLGASWGDPTLQIKLSKKLEDRNYDAFVRTMAELAELLEDCSKKLGISTKDPMKTPENLWNTSSTVEREIKKIKDILLKSIYNDCIEKIKSANTTLQRLVEQSTYKEKIQRKQKLPKRQLLRFKIAQKLAHSLYDIIVQGSCWNCKCHHEHHVQIQLDIPSNIETSESPELSKFQILFASRAATQPSTLWHWDEVESESMVLSISAPVAKSVARDNDIPVQRETKVKFSVAESTLQSIPSPNVEISPSWLPLVDMCATLSGIRSGSMCEERKLIGFLSDQNHRHNFYSVGNSDGQLNSLEALLMTSSNPTKSQLPARMALRRRDRLWLAANLACSVLQFHGSWLKTQWRTRDILLRTGESHGKDILGYPYLSQQISRDLGNTVTQRPQDNNEPTHLIRNKVLFPLGLALVELSLCQTIASLRTNEDDDPVEAIANLKTATRHLPDVRNENGMRYEEVVDKCLYWPDRRNTEFY